MALRPPNARLRVLVGDMSVQVLGHSKDAAPQFVKALGWFASHLEKYMHLPVSLDKGAILSSSEHLADQAEVPGAC